MEHPDSDERTDGHDGIEQMKRAINIFQWLECDNLANNYKKDFEKLVSNKKIILHICKKYRPLFDKSYT